MQNELNMKIEVSSMMGNYVPGSVFQQVPFNLEPTEFSGLIEDIVLPAATQVKFVNEFLRYRKQRIFVVTDVARSQDEHKKAFYFGTWLMERHAERVGLESSMYAVAMTDALLDEYTGAFYNPGFTNRQDPPTVMLLHHVSAYPTPVQIDKVRDFCSRWNCPVIIQGTGCTPLELANRLYMPLHGAMYLTNNAAVLET